MKRFLSPALTATFGSQISSSLLRAAARYGLAAVLGLGLQVSSLGATPAAEPQPLPVSVQTIDRENVRVRIDNPTQRPGRVQVMRVSNGQVLFTEAYSTAAYGHRFNFRDLPTGRYALLLTVDGQEHRYTIEVPSQGQQVAIRSIKVKLPRPEITTATL